MVHRGHSVFDTCNIANGKAYALDIHLDRLLKSATSARVNVKGFNSSDNNSNDNSKDTGKDQDQDVHHYTKHQLKDIVLSTIAASKTKDGFMRMWMSSGRGDFGISSSGVHKGAVMHDQHAGVCMFTLETRILYLVPTKRVSLQMFYVK